jgi:hypothetical protein
MCFDDTAARRHSDKVFAHFAHDFTTMVAGVAKIPLRAVATYGGR